METTPISPGRLTAERFFRDRYGVTGLIILGAMVLFCFLGGILSPYTQQQVFYRQQLQEKPVASARTNTQLRFVPFPGNRFSPAQQAQLLLGITTGQTTVTDGDITWHITQKGENFYHISSGDTPAGYAALDIFTGPDDPGLGYCVLLAQATGSQSFSFQEQTYRLQDGIVYHKDSPVGYVSRLVLQTERSEAFAAAVQQAIHKGQAHLSFEGKEYSILFEGSANLYTVVEQTATEVWDSYAPPSKDHLLGTDKNGMDLLTRLMYGGRVSLLTGFAVVLLSGILGTVLGLVAGYFGGWIDELLMRLVDVFYCIPTTPLLIILGAVMDALRLPVQLRLFYLILVLAALGWPPLTRLVRGQVLSLREQEFMVAAEALGLGAGRRVFRHLLPNVFPQLIATCTMQLGRVILTEATLSFLGLGIKFPFASWGNIMNDVANVFILTDYPFVWIPAGVCLVLTVLGFHFVGDGLRDALDPKSNH